MICLYNPASKKRADYLQKACDIVLQYQPGETVCGLVRHIGREGESARIPLPFRPAGYPGRYVYHRLYRQSADPEDPPVDGNPQRIPNPRPEGGIALNLLLFAGTTEGRELAQELLRRFPAEIYVCVATEYGEQLLPEHPRLHRQTGRMGRFRYPGFYP